MATINPCIRPVNIIFTPSLTTIGESISIPSTAHLRIQVTPTHNGKDIAHIKVWYFDPNSTPSRFNEEIKDADMFKSIAYSMSDTLCHDTLIDQISTYMTTLPPDEVSVIMKEYTKYIENGILLDGFIAGIASYLVFLLLNENSIFMNQTSFQITVPYLISDCNTVTRNMFQYLSLPLSALSKVSNGVLLQLVIFIQSFINIWEPGFSDGPSISNTNESKICMEVISGLANDAAAKLSLIQREHNALMTTLNHIESRLKVSIQESLDKMKREINNFLVETRSSVKNLSDHVTSQLDVVDGRIEQAVSTIDHAIKGRIGKILEDELDNQIKQKIRAGIEETKETIEEIVTHYTINEGKKIVKEAVNQRESQIQGTLVGLEHRIEILYNNLSARSGENIIISGNNNDEPKFLPGSPIELPRLEGIYSNASREPNVIQTKESPTKYNAVASTQMDSLKYQIQHPTKDFNITEPYSGKEYEIPVRLQSDSPTPINEEIPGNVSLTVTPIDDGFDNLRNFQPPGEINTHGPERSIARETININGKRRVPIVRGQAESNPTSLSDPAANWYGPWNSRRVPPS